MERRRLTRTTAWNNYLDGPEAGQVFDPGRLCQVGGRSAVEVVYGITGLGQEAAGPRRSSAVVRGPWGIVNGAHYVKGETPGEDRCRVRTGSSPEVLALRRKVAVDLLGQQRAPGKAAATRRLRVRPGEALPLLLT